MCQGQKTRLPYLFGSLASCEDLQPYFHSFIFGFRVSVLASMTQSLKKRRYQPRRNTSGVAHRDLHEIIKEMALMACKECSCAISVPAMQALQSGVDTFAETVMASLHYDQVKSAD